MKKRKKAILAIAAIVVMGMAITPACIATSGNEDNSNKMASMQGNWIETFDSYETGQYLDGGADDGGWKGWQNDPELGAYVTGDQFLSSPHSVDVEGPTDLVHEFSGYTAGKWTLYTMVYVPNDYEGESAFLILDYYSDDPDETLHWAFWLVYDSEAGVVRVEADGWELPLITGRWVELRFEIDFDEDWFEFYYDGVLLLDKEWTAGWDNSMDGFLDIGCIDIFPDGATSVYYDNMVLAESGKFLGVSGNLNWVEVEPGATVTGEFSVQNVIPGGDPVDWEVSEYPSWGTWTFTPSSGEDLKNEDGPVTVAVEVVAPSDKNQDFSGEIKVVNKANPDDFGTVPVSLATPLNRNSLLLEFFEMLIQRFPLLERIFSLHMLY